MEKKKSKHSGRSYRTPAGKEDIRKNRKHASGLALMLAAVFCVLCVPSIYMNTIYGYLPAIFLAVLLILSRLSLKILGDRITMESGNTDLQCERNSAVHAGLSVLNHSRLTDPKAKACLSVSDVFGENDSVSELYLTLAARSKNNFDFDLDMPHIGLYTIGIKEIELYDFFGIFRRHLETAEEFKVTVLPIIRDPGELEMQETAMAESVRETRTKIPNGSDYIGVREYEQGDAMKQIHWKLSAHSRTYMTKIYESNREMSFSVILDFAAFENDDTEELMEINDCLIETALSLLEEIRRRHAIYALLYTNRRQELCRETVSGRENYGDLVRDFSMICPDPAPGFPDAAVLLQNEQLGINGSSDLLIVTSRVTEELVQEILRTARLEKRPELYYILPARLNSRERELLGKLLLALEEAGIPYTFVSTEENVREHG